LKIYRFLAQYLKPPYPIKTLKNLESAGYR
jgi:hypothetical protein